MRPPHLPAKSLTGWLTVSALAVVAFVALGLARPSLLGFQFDPFGLDRRRIESLREQRDHARSDASARALEVTGERAQAERVDAYSHVLIETRTITAEASAAARSAPDANDPLPSDRADRLRDADRRMCRLAPDVCATAPADPAGGRDGLLSPAGAAEPGDAG
jgi:hypothetical protein